VAELESTEVRDGDPIVLVSLVGVGRSHACLSGECEFSYTVGLHLLRVATLEVKYFLLGSKHL
jgi:hypothetical protein